MTEVSTDTITPHLNLHREASLSFDDDVCILNLRELSGPIGRMTPGLREVVMTLATGPQPEATVASSVMQADGPKGLARWVGMVKQFEQFGFIERSWRRGDEPFLALRSVGNGPSAPAPHLEAGNLVRLTPFALIRPDEATLIAQSPHSHLVAEVGPDVLALLGDLADWSTLDALVAGRPDLAPKSVAVAVNALLGIGLLEQRPESADPDAREPRSIAQWNPFDFWLHSRTRGERLVQGWGATYPMKDLYPPLPARPERFGGATVGLAKPADPADDPSSLRSVMERRRSLRRHDDEHPITIDQLAELLYRSARTRRVIETSDDLDELVDRPYPSGGALHELEVYVAVNRCDGLEPGLWHYRSDEHHLEAVSGPSDQVTALLEAAQSAAQMGSMPQLLLIVSARFGRLMWKYESIAYTLILKHVGVLMSSMYLVATELGLAPCAVGAGDAGTFASATGLDFFAEGSVGEFILGSAPADGGSAFDNWRED